MSGHQELTVWDASSHGKLENAHLDAGGTGLCDGVPAGRQAGGGLGGACGLGYITAPDDGIVGAIGSDDFEIEIAGVRYPALASLKPLYDPSNARIKI